VLLITEEDTEQVIVPVPYDEVPPRTAPIVMP
jgi:hypothetical protein